MKKLKKICSKSSIKPELSHIYVNGDTMQATDSFRWVRLKNKAYSDGYYHQKTLQRTEDTKEFNYPDITKIVDDAKENNTHSINVNRKYLIEVLEALEKGAIFDEVTININPTNNQKPLYITNTNGEALLMPLHK